MATADVRRRGDPPGDVGGVLGGERSQHAAVGLIRSGTSNVSCGSTGGVGRGEEEVVPVVLHPGLAAQAQEVGETLGDDEGERAALLFEDHVGRERRAVHDSRHVAGCDRRVAQHMADAFDHADAWVVGRGRAPCRRGSRPSASASTTSVNVPPTSTPTNQRVARSPLTRRTRRTGSRAPRAATRDAASSRTSASTASRSRASGGPRPPPPDVRMTKRSPAARWMPTCFVGSTSVVPSARSTAYTPGAPAPPPSTPGGGSSMRSPRTVSSASREHLDDDLGAEPAPPFAGAAGVGAGGATGARRTGTAPRAARSAGSPIARRGSSSRSRRARRHRGARRSRRSRRTGSPTGDRRRRCR